jgi:hypothetical protein
MSKNIVLKKVSELQASLRSQDEKIVVKAIKQVKKDGNKDIIPTLLDLLKSSESKTVKKEVLIVLGELKDSSCGEVLIKWLLDSEDVQLNSLVLNTMWNSSLDYSESIAPITKIGLTGDFMCSFEALTIIENLKGPFLETDLMESMVLIREADLASFPFEQKDIITTILHIVDDFSKSV